MHSLRRSSRKLHLKNPHHIPPIATVSPHLTYIWSLHAHLRTHNNSHAILANGIPSSQRVLRDLPPSGYIYGPFGKYYGEVIKQNVKQAVDGYWGKSMLRIWSMMKSQAWAAQAARVVDENGKVGTLERIMVDLRTEFDAEEQRKQNSKGMRAISIDEGIQCSPKPEVGVGKDKSGSRSDLELSCPLDRAQYLADTTAPTCYSKRLPLWALQLDSAPSKRFLADINPSSIIPSSTSNPFHSRLFVQEPAYPNSHLLTLYYNIVLSHPILSRKIYDDRRRLFNGSPPDLVSTPLRKLRLSPFEYNFHAALRRHIWKAKQGVDKFAGQESRASMRSQLETWSWDYWKGLAEGEIKPNGQQRFSGYGGENVWRFRPQKRSIVTQRTKAVGVQKAHGSDQIQTWTKGSHLVDSEVVQGHSLVSQSRGISPSRYPTISLPVLSEQNVNPSLKQNDILNMHVEESGGNGPVVGSSACEHPIGALATGNPMIPNKEEFLHLLDTTQGKVRLSSTADTDRETDGTAGEYQGRLEPKKKKGFSELSEALGELISQKPESTYSSLKTFPVNLAKFSPPLLSNKRKAGEYLTPVVAMVKRNKEKPKSERKHDEGKLRVTNLPQQTYDLRLESIPKTQQRAISLNPKGFVSIMPTTHYEGSNPLVQPVPTSVMPASLINHPQIKESESPKAFLLSSEELLASPGPNPRLNPSPTITGLNPPPPSPEPIHLQSFEASQPATSTQPLVYQSSSIAAAEPDMQQRPSLDPNATLPPSTTWAIRTGFFDTPDDASWVYINTQTLDLPSPTDPNHVTHTYLDQVRGRVKKVLKPAKAIGVGVRNGSGGGGGGSNDSVGRVDDTDVIPEVDYMLKLEKELERVQKKIRRVNANNWASRYKQPKIVSSQTALAEKEVASEGKKEGTDGSNSRVGNLQEQVGDYATTKRGPKWGSGKCIFRHKTSGGRSKGEGGKLP